MDTLFRSGDILNSRYRVLRQLGHGGFGRTYLAEDINRFDEPCVLKQFAPQLQGSFALSKAQELFEREAGVLYRLQHRQIPRFRELFRYKHEHKDYLLLVQDYVEGQTYHELFNQYARERRKLSEAEITWLLSQTLPILEYIHAMGMIHRDISPDNIILRSVDKLPMLIDFGSIKEVENKAQFQLIKAINSNDSLSLMGTVIGKNGYAPPEQIERGIVFAHSDLYALAATVVVLLTGKEPQQLIEPNSYLWYWQEEVNVSPKLESILTTMLAPQPRDRFDNATEVIKRLQKASIVHSTPQRTQTVVPQLSKNKTNKTRSFNFKLWMFVPLIAAILLGSFWGLKNRDLTIASSVTNSQSFVRQNSQLSNRFSQGEKVLITQAITLEKELAVTAFERGNFKKATALFSASLDTLPNDPETLIYLNNARIGNQKAYSIAVSVPISSDVNAAQEILRGVAQAQNSVNQTGGIANIPLEIQIIDDGNDPEIARQLAKILSQDLNILGVIGHYASDVTLATTKIYQSARLVAISPVSTSVKLSELSPYFFRTVPSDYLAARSLAEYMLEKLNRKQVAVYYTSQSNYSESLKSEFITAVALNGGRVTHTFDLSEANFSAANSFKQAMNGGAEVIMLAADSGTLDKALQVVQVNRNRLDMLGGDDIYTPKTLQVAGARGENMVLAIPWHIKAEPNAKFAVVSKKLWGGEVNWRTAMAYDATQAFITAIGDSIAEGIARSPTRIGIQKVLANPDFSALGACDRVRFLPSGDRLKAIELVKIQPQDNSIFKYEFLPIAAKR
ncbi:bifunctional serine/threonine-protein kinase/ABC transporter substrate-binding protein [Myxosarcina sp. GI1]|uniref:bifunctional serine/threonine-protein kinase/ABC transporter substrate-binding protein n=1 Tax=Myxosarcina sp. GI1 TaxID=1541065 RepID=UPI000A8E34EE|nr:bifunctional serine/threonine-protein kinase/ABC transporter substrate-binding protein [Myxosarcina sp. GI1]